MLPRKEMEEQAHEFHTRPKPDFASGPRESREHRPAYAQQRYTPGPPERRSRSPQERYPSRPEYPAYKERKSSSFQPSLPTMKWIIAIGLIVATIGYYAWRHMKKKKVPDPLPISPVRVPLPVDTNPQRAVTDHQLYLQSQQQEALRGNMSALQQQVVQLQQQQAQQVQQLQKYQQLQKAHLNLLQKVQELTQGSRPPSPPLSMPPAAPVAAAPVVRKSGPPVLPPPPP